MRDRPIFKLQNDSLLVYAPDGIGLMNNWVFHTEEDKLRAFQRVFDLGRADKAAEIRQVLGV
jgi:hypothetical protein